MRTFCPVIAANSGYRGKGPMGYLSGDVQDCSESHIIQEHVGT